MNNQETRKLLEVIQILLNDAINELKEENLNKLEVLLSCIEIQCGVVRNKINN